MQTAWKRRQQQQGVVPFLGSFLTELFMLDTAMEEYLEGNEVNHRKKNKEYRVLTEILLLQVAADRYRIEPEQPFRAWFQSGTWAQRGGELHPVLPAGAPSRPPDRRSWPQSPSGLSRGAGASRGRGPSVRHHFLPPLLLGGRYVMVLTHKWKISML
ncbi:ral guanine nucleotide dissociation stimulator-like 3 isoform X2 [Canis lupus familiaris]|uniref:ral guanine nucleotide dissociation stimulator-like 3 isoform X2 n=1 Tax=Canis lupus familiaris TaxID=9615 RepID=UPI0018F3E0AD|nr:ral guanine nucleotide dissociation stimulator-like 3 isoform X2 [Canis lupus familiaris]